jgi:hypothetical protein
MSHHTVSLHEKIVRHIVLQNMLKTYVVSFSLFVTAILFIFTPSPLHHIWVATAWVSMSFTVWPIFFGVSILKYVDWVNTAEDREEYRMKTSSLTHA